ncbi:MAG: hypothetical protein UD961_02715 [Bacteroidales bacterium]|nr:hypothetical protein [Bacteroidales bacterium]
MMKKILIYMFSMLWLLASCQEPELLERPVCGDSEGMVEVTFSVLMPDDALATKAFGESPATDIKSMYVIVFDENGYYIDAHEATLLDPVADHNSHKYERAFKVTLRKTEKERIIHFIANCPVEQIHYGHESDIISSLYVSRGSQMETAYWYRTEVWYIKTKENTNVLVDEVADKFKCVPLLRNYASITVLDGVDDKVFNMESYAVYNTIDRGTVAPYNIEAHGFQSFIGDGNALLPYATLRDTYKYYGHALPSATLKTTLSDSDFIAPDEPTYMYERKVSVRAGAEHQWSESPPHIIIKGRYNNAAAYSYYKVDLLRYDNNKSYYYNILRNFKYTFTIKEVAGPGYPTLAEAMSNPAGNNLAGATDTQGFTNVSDGLGRIFVSYTDTTLTSNAPIKLRYKYIPSIQNYNVTANDRVLVEGILDGTGSVIKGRVDGYTDLTGEMSGWREVTLNVQNPGAITHVQEIYLNVQDNSNLHKTIRYRLQRPLNLLVNCWPQYIAKAAGKLMDVAIRIPTDLTPDLFPLDFAIEVQDHTLSPDASQLNNVMPVEPALSIVPDKAGKRSYHYVKTIDTYEDYLALEMYGDLKLIRTNWLTTRAENASTVYVYNKYFNLASDQFFNAESFTLLTFPDGVPSGAGKAVAFHFNMNSVTPVTVTLEGLSLSPGDKSQTTSFTYSPVATGRQDLPTLYTVNETGKVKVTLSAPPHYADAYLEAEQSSEVTISKLTVTFTHSNPRPDANTVAKELKLMVNGNEVTPGRVTGVRSGNNFTITCENVVFEGVTNQSVVTATYSHSSGWSHKCSYSGSSTIGNLISHPTINMTAQ